jgi:hypothetical protein
MANDKIAAVPPMPPKGEMIPAQSLYMQQISLYRNTLAFGGTRNPSEIWACMKYNLPQTMAYYRELEEKDEDVGNALDGLKLSVMERSTSVLPANDKDSLAVDVKEFVEDQLTCVNFDEVLDCVLDAPGYGFSVQEMIFDTSEGQAQLMDINDCPQELFLFGDRWHPQIGQLELLDNPWASGGTPVPEQKFLIFSYRKRSRNRMGRPLLKEVFWPSWFKRNIQRLWVQFAEKGPGTAVVHYNDPDNESDRKRAVEIAQALIDNVAIAVPHGFEFEPEMLKIARAQDPKVYQAFFEKMQHSIMRRIQGETLTTFGSEDGRGSQAQGKTHADTFDTRSVSLSKAVMSVVNDQLVRPLVLWNYGPNAPMPRWMIETKTGEDLGNRLEIDMGLQSMGKKFTVGYISQRYDVPLAAGENGEDADDILVPAAGAAPQVKIADRSTATFAERQAEADNQAQMAQYDKLFAQLQGEAKGIFAQRVKEIAAKAAPKSLEFRDGWVEIDDHPVHFGPDGKVDMGRHGSERKPIEIDESGVHGATPKQAAFIDNLRDKIEEDAAKSLEDSQSRFERSKSVPVKEGYEETLRKSNEIRAADTLIQAATIHAMDALPTPANSKEASKMIDALQSGVSEIVKLHPDALKAYQDAVTRFGYSEPGTATKAVEGLHSTVIRSGSQIGGTVDSSKTLANLRKR